MNKAAVTHRCSAPYAYPAGPDQLRVVLKAARGDLREVRAFYRDRYAPDDTARTAVLDLVAADEVSDYWAATLPERRVFYQFHLTAGDGEEAWYNEQGFWDGAPALGGFIYPYIAPADAFHAPSWLDGGTVFYQIFPDRFENGDPSNDPPGVVPWGSEPTPENLQGGDLQGVIRRLDHLSDLGVGGLYMTPIFESTSNHKYNTRDYYRIDPSFGSESDLRRLVADAHQRGIRVLLDAVFNHSGHDFFAFVDCIEKGPASPYWDWFNIRGDRVQTEYPCNYETFATHLTWMPKLMTQNPEVAAYLLDVSEHWLKAAGIDGWRLDVANEVDHAFWRAFRQRVKGTNPEAWILGEIWHDSSDWLRGDQFDSVMNYPFRDAILAFFQHGLPADRFDAMLARVRMQYPWDVTANLLTLLGTHDTPRIRTLLGRERSLLATAILLTYPGVPLIYYGDEVGMEGGADPGCRGAMDWSGETWDRDALALHKTLVKTRRAFPWLREGGFRTVMVDAARGLYGFARTAAVPGFPGRSEPAERAGQTNRAVGCDLLLTLVNNGAEDAPVSLEVEAGLTEPLVDILSRRRYSVEAGQLRLTLPSLAAAVLVPESQARTAGLL